MCLKLGIEGSKKLSLKEVLALYNHFGYPGEYQVKVNIPSA